MNYCSDCFASPAVVTIDQVPLCEQCANDRFQKLRDELDDALDAAEDSQWYFDAEGVEAE